MKTVKYLKEVNEQFTFGGRPDSKHMLALHDTRSEMSSLRHNLAMAQQEIKKIVKMSDYQTPMYEKLFVVLDRHIDQIETNRWWGSCERATTFAKYRRNARRTCIDWVNDFAKSSKVKSKYLRTV